MPILYSKVFSDQGKDYEKPACLTVVQEDSGHYIWFEDYDGPKRLVAYDLPYRVHKSIERGVDIARMGPEKIATMLIPVIDDPIFGQSPVEPST